MEGQGCAGWNTPEPTLVLVLLYEETTRQTIVGVPQIHGKNREGMGMMSQIRLFEWGYIPPKTGRTRLTSGTRHGIMGSYTFSRAPGFFILFSESVDGFPFGAYLTNRNSPFAHYKKRGGIVVTDSVKK
jgi:hypothetical protein